MEIKTASNQPRILVIGSTKVAGATRSLTWNKCIQKCPVLGDYDLVIFYLPSFTFSRKDLGEIRGFAQVFRKKIFDALWVKKELICITAPEIKEGEITNYSIFPFQLTVKNEEGETFEEKPDKGYFSKVKDWKYCFSQVISSREEQEEEYLSWQLKSLLNTGHGYPISFFARLLVGGTEGEPIGFVQFLPPQSRLSAEQCIKNIIKMEFPEKSYVIPDFVQKIVVPGEKIIKEQLVKTKTIVKEATEKEIELNKKLRQINFKKGALVFKGKLLVKATVQLLRDMDISIKEVEQFEEDKTIVIGRNSLPVEITGHKKGVTEGDLMQIYKHVGKAKIDKDVPTRGILIACPYNDTPLKDRGRDFEPGVIKKAEPWGICLLSTRVLFKYWVNYLKTGKTDLNKKLLNTVGVLNI